MGSNSHRPWSVPDRSPALRMRWHDVLFLHWPIPADKLTPAVPDALNLETYNGTAWIGVIPFWMSRIRPRFLPAVPYFSSFPELNIRTYVTDGAHPGVWFFTLEAQRWLAVKIARWTYSLNYRWADMAVNHQNDQIDYRSQRKPAESGTLSFEGTYVPGSPVKPDEDSLETFLTERYCLYSQDSSGTIYRGDIDHPSWPLHQADVSIDHLETDEPGSVALNGPPESILYSPELDVRAWSPQPVKT